MPRAAVLLFLLLAACTGHEGRSRARPAVAPEDAAPADAWETAKTLADLTGALREASARPLVIDFHAAWCMPCLELQERTFVDPAVAAELQRFTRIKIDVTDDTAGELQRLFAVDTLPNVQIYAPGHGLGPALAGLREGVALPQPLHRVKSFVTADQLTPLLAAARGSAADRTSP